jgi:hypothetical protein
MKPMIGAQRLFKLIRIQTIFILFMCAAPIVGCSPSLEQRLQEMKKKEYAQTTSKEAFTRAESKIQSLKSGDSIKSTGLDWKVNPIQDRSGKVVSVIAVSDGWIGALSGNVDGALSGFGDFYGRSGNTVYGEHIFGYILNDIVLVPLYLVRTQAELIPESEFRELLNKKTANIGSVRIPGEMNSEIYFKDVRVDVVQKLDLPEIESADFHFGNSITGPEFSETFFTVARFEQAETKLRAIKPGMELFDVIKVLEGRYIAYNSGEKFVLFTDGFLKYKGEYVLERLTPDGIFTVWPFGYMEGEKEIPKVALIFKNGKVLKIMPYTSREEVKKNFSQ